MSAEKLTLEKLETWLWDSADIMRGSIDSSDFKNYIFGLIFLKRLNDVFLERIDQEMEKEGCSKEEAIAIIEEDYTNEFVPVDARWDNIIKKTENIGESIDEAFAEIEAQNTDLERVLTAIKFGDKERLSNDLLQRLLRHFNKHKLGNNNLYKADMLGDAYEYLIAQFADDAGKKGGEFYTPHGVVELIVKLIDPQPGHEIYDPTFGCGGMLVESARHIAEKPNGMRFGKPNCVLYGQERNLGTWAIGKLNLFLHNMTAKLERGDTLVDPKHKDGNNILSFDRVIANPPFSALDWWTPLEANKQTKTDKNGNVKEVAPKYSKELKDPYGRFNYGIAPRKKADLAFVQHMVASLKEDGRMGVVVPHGVLFRDGEEGKIRKAMLKGVNDFKGDLIEGIIGLPTGLFYNTGIAAAIILINKNKPAALKDKVIFIDASEGFEEGKNQNKLRDIDIQTITSRFNKAVEQVTEAGEQTQEQTKTLLEQVEVEKYLRVVEMDEIEQNGFNLNINLYIDTSEEEEIISITDVLESIQKIDDELNVIDAELSKYLPVVGV
ncbi:class I SAM-dependent DNA methyltransferase [Pseudoalteromonas sp. MMG022]|uniref:type I restriction-modification system subunit M n=1 Tax=Pseudoalteromonas sp. MMG022 TaxID=2909978 RepID=UPI001F398A5A|nr:class I SAM-dependent DNA methyltransferase [Pseudoalteromonas sp. MMG022]MCF6437183.1 type I restriction-modification system subunit M [Pseudoalteromonas sp. MMG022]